MDEVFGEDMFIGNVIWEKTYSPQNMNKFISCNHDYIAIYRKSKSLEKFTGLPRTENQNRRYTNRDNDPRGDWKSGDFSCMGKNQNRRYTNIDNDPRGDWASDNFSCMGKNNIYPITNPIGKIIYPPEGRSWKFSKEKYEKLKQDNRIWFGKDGNAKPSFKLFLNEAQQHIVTQTIWRYENVGHTDGNTKQLKTIFNGKAVFDFPKGTKLITKMLQISTSSNDIILDFFAGSGTTGHAVMQLNLEEKKQAIENGEDPTLVGNRKYIMVQLPELIDEKTDAYKAGYKKISDITIERVKRAGNKISEENPDVNLDVGFKVCELIS